MAEDARINTALPSHPKTKKLIRRLGAAAGWHLVCLFLWVSANRSDGDLSGLSDEDVELAVDWAGEDGAFVSALASVGFLDGETGSYSIHDWAEHNPWAAGSEARSVKARWNAAKRHHGEAEADRLVPEYRATSNATSTAPSKNDSAERNAPSPSPSPSPSPKARAGKVTLEAWIAGLDGADAVPADDPLFDWAAKVGLPRDWIALAWWAFEGRYTDNGQGADKTYTDWRKTFRNAVKEDWLKLWRHGDNGYFLTTTGKQAELEMRA